jgi:hypothetical protein
MFDATPAALGSDGLLLDVPRLGNRRTGPASTSRGATPRSARPLRPLGEAASGAFSHANAGRTWTAPLCNPYRSRSPRHHQTHHSAVGARRRTVRRRGGPRPSDRRASLFADTHRDQRQRRVRGAWQTAGLGSAGLPLRMAYSGSFRGPAGQLLTGSLRQDQFALRLGERQSIAAPGPDARRRVVARERRFPLLGRDGEPQSWRLPHQLLCALPVRACGQRRRDLTRVHGALTTARRKARAHQ